MSPDPVADTELAMHADDRPVTLSALLGADVVGADGEALGHVQDIRLVRQASSRASWGATPAAALIVDGRHAGSLLGYDRRAEQGPAVLRAAIRWLHRRARVLGWEDVDVVRDARGRVTVRVRR